MNQFLTSQRSSPVAEAVRLHVPELARVLLLTFVFAFVSLSVAGASARGDENGAQVAYFEKHVRPVLVEHCYACHSAKAADEGKLKAGLQLDTRAGIRAGGESGPAVVPGDVNESLLIDALRHESFEMPPTGKLPQTVIDHFATWIKSGAADPRDGAIQSVETKVDIEAGRSFWAFQPLRLPDVPRVHDNSWPRTSIDHFILAELEKRQLRPLGDADQSALLRRVYFDLIGLPPTVEELDAFLADDSSEAWLRVVDQLLESPHFGERWGQHWMDVVRYADSVGGGANMVFDNAWRYRDYIIRSYNDDKPFDQFVREQIAGDLRRERCAAPRSNHRYGHARYRHKGTGRIRQREAANGRRR